MFPKEDCVKLCIRIIIENILVTQIFFSHQGTVLRNPGAGSHDHLPHSVLRSHQQRGHQEGGRSGSQHHRTQCLQVGSDNYLFLLSFRIILKLGLFGTLF